MALKYWNDLPVSVRKSPRKLWNYLCDEINEPPEKQNISLTIKCGDVPIQGAKVTIGKVSKTTGSQGGCSFTGIEEGDHKVHVTKEHFEDKTATITVDDDHTSFNIGITSVTYAFESFQDSAATEKDSEGTVQLTGVASNGYLEVEVITSDPNESWIGVKCYVVDTAKPDGTTIYQLYEDAGTTSLPFYVKISTVT